MPTVQNFLDWLQEFAPARLAADWDNVGLLIGDRSREVTRVLACLTVTTETVSEAVREQAQLIISHHPFPFHAAKRITADSHPGRLLLTLIEAKIAVISPHTAFDSALQGINQQLAARLGIEHPLPLTADQIDPRLGTGRYGRLAAPLTLAEFCSTVAAALGIKTVQYVGDGHTAVEKVAVACGAAGEFLAAAQAVGCDCFVTGEARFHTALEAAASGMTMVLLGHYASERFAVEELARQLQSTWPNCTTTAAADEQDPITTIQFPSL